MWLWRGLSQTVLTITDVFGRQLQSIVFAFNGVFVVFSVIDLNNGRAEQFVIATIETIPQSYPHSE